MGVLKPSTQAARPDRSEDLHNTRRDKECQMEVSSLPQDIIYACELRDLKHELRDWAQGSA